jgi:hypothetical protein
MDTILFNTRTHPGIRIYLLLIFFVFTYVNTNAQDKDSSVIYPLQIDLPVFDLPFMWKASKTGVLGDNFSMEQSLAVTQNIHRLNYHYNNRLWYNIIQPTNKKKKVFNRIAANVSAGIIDYAYTYYFVAFSIQWMHEEFHRSDLTLMGISSYDETYNRFTGGYANGSVSKVKDEDLIRLKREAPQKMVRSFAAGIESEFLLLRGLQRDNFFEKSKYPNILLNILLTNHAIGYVNQFRNSDYNASIDSMNKYGTSIADRDYVGWDFTPWVYDLHRPNEAYDARGMHPGGNGINRAIKTTDLNREELDYLKKMGRMQYLNYISPFMIGINRIPIGKNTAFNFAVRHYLNSFGYDLTTDFFVDHKGKQFLLSLHGYSSKNLFLPGIEMEWAPVEIRQSKNNNRWSIQPSVMFWMQPDDFYASKGNAGGLLRVKTAYSMNDQWKIYTTVEGKTKGWVAGNPFLDANFSVRTGIYARLRKKMKV